MPEIAQIRLLTDHVINKIAAGEVVERPASVLKELIENSVDAQATSIDVDVTAGGKRLVSVRDNGVGMSRDDALLGIERHATSKIRDVDDIENIQTLGFRGEALAAISAVSRFRLVTRRHEDLEGTEVEIHGGTIQQVRAAGAPPGTVISVRNLFYNIPARRKFLRTDQTEISHLRQMFLVHALAHPKIAMHLVVDDRPLYELSGDATLADRVRELFSADLLSSLHPVEYRDADVQVSGYVGSPSVHRADRSEQYVFVNGRAASAALVGSALREAYQSSLPKARFPVVFMFLELDAAQIDVNVHPTKKEVRFRRPREVRDGIIAAIHSAFGNQPAMTDRTRVVTTAPAGPTVAIRDIPALEPFPYPKVSVQTEWANVPGGESAIPAGGANREGFSGDDGDREMPWAWCRVLGQVGGLYVVLETDGGLVLMDPHAAHERVLFESYLSEISNQSIRSQGLLVPETVQATPQEAERIRAHLQLLIKMGFGVSDFGGNSFMVDAMPSCMDQASAAAVLSDVVVAIEESGVRGGQRAMLEEVIARAACRAAAAGNRSLKVKELEQLILDLAKSEMPYTCPHGRPTIIFMGFRELDRKFGRT
jgi:DNA mismatch repair protein MutL